MSRSHERRGFEIHQPAPSVNPCRLCWLWRCWRLPASTVWSSASTSRRKRWPGICTNAVCRHRGAGNPEAALGDFRAALSYSHDNSQYQLSLARALRDTGRTAEAETYLISLWERTPQEGPVNLALGRLFAREQQFDKAIQYYHNAIYGFWASDADTKTAGRSI